MIVYSSFLVIHCAAISIFTFNLANSCRERQRDRQTDRQKDKNGGEKRKKKKFKLVPTERSSPFPS